VDTSGPKPFSKRVKQLLDGLAEVQKNLHGDVSQLERSAPDGRIGAGGRSRLAPGLPPAEDSVHSRLPTDDRVPRAPTHPQLPHPQTFAGPATRDLKV